MKKDLFTTLKELQNIQPDAAYSRRSKDIILALKKQPEKLPVFAFNSNPFADIFEKAKLFVHLHQLAAALSVAAAFVFIIYFVVSQMPGNSNELVAKANEINASIQIKLDEVEYYLNSQKQISSSTAIELNDLLEKSSQELIQAKELSNSSSTESLEKSLKKIKSAQETLLGINSLLQSQK